MRLPRHRCHKRAIIIGYWLCSHKWFWSMRHASDEWVLWTVVVTSISATSADHLFVIIGSEFRMTVVSSHNSSWGEDITRRLLSLDSECSFLEGCGSVSQSPLLRQPAIRYICELLISGDHESLDFLCELFKAFDEVFWLLALLNNLKLGQSAELSSLHLSWLIWEAATSECPLVCTVFSGIESRQVTLVLTADSCLGRCPHFCSLKFVFIFCLLDECLWWWLLNLNISFVGDRRFRVGRLGLANV